MRLTAHAIERYQQRIAPWLKEEPARRELKEASQRAIPLPDKRLGDAQLWRIDSPPMRLITKRDGGEYVILTVLLPTQPGLAMLRREHQRRLIQEREARIGVLEPKTAEHTSRSDSSDKREVLALELKILESEVELLRQETGSSEEAVLRDGLRVAVLGLVGEVQRESALARLKSISPRFLAASFYRPSSR
jgi:hypothetical protein